MAVEHHPLFAATVRAALLCNEATLHRAGHGGWSVAGAPTIAVAIASFAIIEIEKASRGRLAGT